MGWHGGYLILWFEDGWGRGGWEGKVQVRMGRVEALGSIYVI